MMIDGQHYCIFRKMEDTRNAAIAIAAMREDAKLLKESALESAKSDPEITTSAFMKLSTTTSLSHAEILKQIGVKKRTWYDWISKGYITIR